MTRTEDANTEQFRHREHIALILGCRWVKGSCMVHQPRHQWEQRRPGCPYVDSLLGQATHRAG